MGLAAACIQGLNCSLDTRLQGPPRRLFLALDVSALTKSSALGMALLADWIVQMSQRRVFIALVHCPAVLQTAIEDRAAISGVSESTKEGLRPLLGTRRRNSMRSRSKPREGLGLGKGGRRSRGVSRKTSSRLRRHGSAVKS